MRTKGANETDSQSVNAMPQEEAAHLAETNTAFCMPVGRLGGLYRQIIAALPAARQARVNARFAELKDQVNSLGELRRVAGKAQADVAAALNIKQPSVSKIEQQADLYLSTLRGYVEAIGGELALVVNLPDHAPLRLSGFGDLATEDTTTRQRPLARPSQRAKAAAPR
jgi:hypothetical protein